MNQEEITMSENQKTTYTDERNRWAKENVLELANHFHRFSDSKKQFERVEQFVIDENDLQEFNKNLNRISKMRICLALRERNIHEFTFFPILKVTYDKSTDHYYKLVCEKQNNTDDSQTKTKHAVTSSVEVPKIFKDMIHRNWNGIEFNLIDDLFIANEKGLPVRVLEYIIGEHVINTIIKKLNNIIDITFYMGVDMNKFQNKELISFTPVLGFKYKKTVATKKEFAVYEALKFGPSTSLQNDFGELFIEYSSPCPPTC